MSERGNFKFFRGVLLASFAMVNLAVAQDAPPRPECTESVPCEFNEVSELGAGARVILFDHGNGGHGGAAGRLFNSLNELSQEKGFILTRKSNAWSNLSDAELSNAKVIIYSSSDGDVGGSIPNTATRDRVESFVKERGWGLLMIHAACAFISSWPFLQDACIQQYNHHNPSGTPATHYIENGTFDGEAHGLANPYTNFLLKDIDERVQMQDEWYTWRGNPRTSHENGPQRNAQIQNRIMLTALDETTYNSPDPKYPGQHYTAWTHTMGNGIVIYNSIGHDDLWRINADSHGKELLWRQLRYVAKDWGPAATLEKVCNDPEAGNAVTVLDPNTQEADNSLCKYCGDDSFVEYVPGKDQEQYDNSLCEVAGINISGVPNNEFITTNELNISITHEGEYNLTILKVNGDIVFNKQGFGSEVFANPVKEAGIYYVNVSATGYKTYVKKLLVH